MCTQALKYSDVCVNYWDGKSGWNWYFIIIFLLIVGIHMIYVSVYSFEKYWDSTYVEKIYIKISLNRIYVYLSEINYIP